MTVKVFIDGTEHTVHNSALFDERLDEQFDTGTVQLVSESAEPFSDFCEVKIWVSVRLPAGGFTFIIFTVSIPWNGGALDIISTRLNYASLRAV